MKVIEFKEQRNAKETLRERAESSDEIEAVLILELHKDGTQRQFSSMMDMHERCFLKCFFDANITEWFRE